MIRPALGLCHEEKEAWKWKQRDLLGSSHRAQEMDAGTWPRIPAVETRELESCLREENTGPPVVCRK